jgi:hypothetical protein
MRANQSVLERAFEMAQSGEFKTLNPLIRQLSREGYVNPERQLMGPFLRRQLLQLIKISQSGGNGPERAQESQALICHRRISTFR